MPDTPDRLRGALLGLAVGDALGTTVEFKPPGSFEPVTDMVGGGPFGLKPGQWTDDTSMALCLAVSIAETEGFDPVDQLARYVKWWREGYLSSTGRCFDIGNQTRAALIEFQRKTAPFCGGPLSSTSAGNGSLMRLAPVPMAYWRSPEEAVRLAGDSSRTTHGARECVDACRYFAGLLAGLFAGASKDEVLAPMYAPVSGLWEAEPLMPAIATIAAGSFREKSPSEIGSRGRVSESLEVALWAFAKHDSFEDAVLAAVNLGGDADTNAAICGQVAGACWGASGIPAKWLDVLAMRETIERLTEGLIEFGEE
jgi:ADP-ribosyl-[dinitrogen reductase] hydrolase